MTSQLDVNFDDKSSGLNAPLLAGDSASVIGGPVQDGPQQDAYSYEGSNLNKSARSKTKMTTFSPGTNAVSQMRMSVVHETPQEGDATAIQDEQPMAEGDPDDIENNTDKSIDFNAQLQALKKRTETELPHTLSQVEDIMYLDQYSVVALEYHYYQNDCKYINLLQCDEQVNEEGDLVCLNGEKASHKLGTENFQKKGTPHPMSAFERRDVINYVEDQQDTLKLEKQLSRPSFMKVTESQIPKDGATMRNEVNKLGSKMQKLIRGQTKGKEEPKMVEAILALYKVTPLGGMQRSIQVDVKMGRKFFSSENGNMVLTRSKDKKVISLTNFDENDDNGEYFRTLAWTNKLKKFETADEFQSLNIGMNAYYSKVKDSFDQLVEVSFVGNSKFVQLIYIEAKARSLVEQQLYEQQIQEDGISQGSRNVDTFAKRQAPRKAKKYVFFDVCSGNVVFEYGGAKDPMQCFKANGDKVEIFELGVLVKEIREEAFNPQLVFFFTGDFMDNQIKEQQFMFQWAMNAVLVGMKQLFEMESPQEQQELIQTHINAVVSKGQLDGYLNYYPFDQTWILKHKFNWEQNIQVSCNRKFTQYAMLNNKNDDDNCSSTTFWVHGPQFRDLVKVQSLRANNYLLDVAYFAKLPGDAKCRHSRNSNVKDQLFYDVLKNNEVKTYCLRLDHADTKSKVMVAKIPISNFVSQNDIWLQFRRNKTTNVVEDIFQTIHISKGDQTGVLSTKMPKSMRNINSSDQDDIVERKTNMFYQYQADLPCICYNLGDSKVILQNTLQTDNKRKFIINLMPDEKFVCFLQFNQFEDIGFYPKGLRIECCSHFAFLTAGKGPTAGHMTKNRINLVLIDPFYEKTQVAHFRSNTHFDNEIFACNDTMVVSVVQSTMSKKRDLKFKSYIWTQFPDQLIRSSLMKCVNGTLDQEDSDVEAFSDKDDDEEITGKQTFEQVKMIMSERDFIYYVTKKNGKCFIMEGNPRDQYIEHHEAIFQLKAERCLSFSIQGPDTFYFMDEQHVVHKMIRNINNRSLILEKELTMKEIQRLDFNPVAFDSVIMNEKYAIQGTKIFYLYDLIGDQFPEGIFEAEDLVAEDKTKPKLIYNKGPTCMQGSHRFFNIYQHDKFTSKIRIFQKPDQTEKVIINDFLNWVDMSTFLESGKILIKIRRRFMVFTGDGAFIDEIEFNNESLKNNEITEKDKPKINYQTFQEQKANSIQLGSGEQSNVSKLERRRQKNPIQDFQGHTYEFQTPEPPVPLSENNKMELLNMDFTNRWYLFFDRMAETLCLYEMCEIPVPVNYDESFLDFTGMPKTKITFQFVLRNQINYDKSQLFQQLYNIGIDPINYYRKNVSQIMISSNGNVKLCYVENLPFVDKQNQSGYSDQGADNEKEVIQCKLSGAVFSIVPGHFQMKCQNFMTVFDFPRDASQKLVAQYENKKHDLDRKINNIRAAQARLPKKLFDYGQYENLIDDLLELEGKSTDIVYAKIYSENLVIIYCGQYVKFGKLQVPNKKNSKKKSKNEDLVFVKSDGKYIKDMAVFFSDDTEVIKVVETVNKNWLQLMLMDHAQEIITVVTWDFDNNMEQCIMQQYVDPNLEVGYHMVKGMNQKRNYFITQDYLTDLEYNIPLRQSNVNQNLNLQVYSYRKQLQMSNDFFNQRKLYEDSSKFLGVEKAFCLFYPLSRMDLLLWQNINVLGERADLIQQTCTIQQFNLVIDGISLFHYFADNSELIEQIHTRYNNEKQNDQLSLTERTLPLQILNPDNTGKTALFLAVASQSPASFECMIDMLKDFPDQCISKMMLKSLALIVSHESSAVIDFFECNIFQPPQMQIQQFIPWGDDMEEFIFPCHTSIISRELLYQKLAEKGVVQEATISKPKSKSAKVLDEEPETLTRRQKVIESKKQLRKLELDESFDNGLEEGEEPLKRVQIECLDIDWIFDGENSKILLSVLASDANNAALTKKSIRIFVELMWAHYQSAIIKFIFVPYMAYLFVLSQLAGSVAGEFIDILYEDLEQEENQVIYTVLKTKCYVLISIATSLMICFGSLEVKQMIADGIDYFSDYWNCIDAMSLTMNSSFLFTLTFNCVGEFEHFNVQLIRTFGAFACFFMWIKVFYWMRLFSALAYYVKLIQQTISDSMNFMLMVFLIICSFANFYYVVDRNMKTTGQGRYYDQYTSDPENGIDHSIVDVIISIYMMGALGDFDSTIYRVGYDRYFAFAMFVLATFIISVVFMNMLIAIMGDTFGQVLEVAEESGLREQVVLIADHAWLLDLKKIFKGQKYIILVKPSTSSQESDNAVVDQCKETEATIVKRLERLQDFVGKRVDSVDTNTRFLLKYQQMSIETVTKRVKSLDTMFKETIEEVDQEFQNLTDEQKEVLNQQKKKKNEILQMLNSQTSGQTLTIDKVQEVALNWMELADKDGNGELDFQEFYDFFSKIEDIVVTEQEIRQIFDDFDGSGNGYLSVEEFARAIYQAVLADQDEYSDDEYGLEQQDI